MSRYKGDILMLLCTICWGTSYLFIKIATRTLSTFNLMAFRFTLAFILTALVYRTALRRLNRGGVGYGVLLGATLFCSNALLTFGLQTTTIGNAGFLIGLTVVFVALIQTVLDRAWPGRYLLIGLVLSVLGIGVLTLSMEFRMHLGDALCILCAFVFAVYIFIVGKAARNHDPAGVCVVHFGVTGLLAWAAALLFGTVVFPADATTLLATCCLAVFGSVIGTISQLVGQRYATPTRAAFIFTLEPLFAILFACLFAGEELSLRTVLGGGLLLAGVYVSEYRPKRAEER